MVPDFALPLSDTVVFDFREGGLRLRLDLRNHFLPLYLLQFKPLLQLAHLQLQLLDLLRRLAFAALAADYSSVFLFELLPCLLQISSQLIYLLVLKLYCGCLRNQLLLKPLRVLLCFGPVLLSTRILLVIALIHLHTI